MARYCVIPHTSKYFVIEVGEGLLAPAPAGMYRYSYLLSVPILLAVTLSCCCLLLSLVSVGIQFTGTCGMWYCTSTSTVSSVLKHAISVSAKLQTVVSSQ